MPPTRRSAPRPSRPTAMPIRPPRPDSVSASMRNWARMSRRRAPTALRMPISRVRSRTETSMMFMIPMPPTISEIEAMPAEQQRQRAADRVGGLEQLRLVEDREVVVVGRGEAVARPQERRDLGLDRGHLRLVGDADADRPDVVARDEVLADDADRHHDLVVGVLEAGAALGLEDADQLERQAADGDLAADRAGVEPEVVGGRGARAPRRAGPARPRCRSGRCPATRRRRGPSA